MQSVLLREDLRNFRTFWQETIPYRFGKCTEIDIRQTRTSNKVVTNRRVKRFGNKPPIELLKPREHTVLAYDLGYLDNTKTRKVFVYSYHSESVGDIDIVYEPLEV